jgi:hypothetical protein
MNCLPSFKIGSMVLCREWSVIFDGMNCIDDYQYIYGDGSLNWIAIYMY